MQGVTRVPLYRSEHRATIREPERFPGGVLRRKELRPGVSVVYARICEDGPMRIQAIVFDSRLWSPAHASAWLELHGYTPIRFEPSASGGTVCSLSGLSIVQVDDSSVASGVAADLRAGGANACARGNLVFTDATLED